VLIIILSSLALWFLVTKREEYTMSSTVKRRDYSLTGPEGKLAKDKGLVEAEWYTCTIPRKRLKELMKRKDGPAIRDTLVWFALLVGSGVLAYHSWGTWWAIPAFAIYGILYGSVSDSRWHECSHGTAFKTTWINEVIYQIASFMCLRPGTPWRWSHTRHHTDTIIVGRDPEIIAPRPPIWHIILMEFIKLHGGPRDLKRVFIHCVGKLSKEEKEFIPSSQYRKTFWESRIYALIFLAVLVWCITVGSIQPAMFIILPTFYGSFLMLFYGFTQHLGLNEDVLDHRLNSRTVYMNPINRFIYWNMNYHVEHHMFPMVPYHALPALHEEMKDDCPKACPSLWAALKEVFAALKRQGKDPSYTIMKPLPSTALPYRYGPNENVAGFFENTAREKVK
jgi:fatty acid desaturase